MFILIYFLFLSFDTSIFCVFQGSDEELMAHSEDEHEVDTVANKGQCQELFISEQQGRFQMCRS